MGDRCFLSITLHGTIQTVEHLSDILTALEAERMQPNDFSGRTNLAAHLLASAEAGEAPTFVAEEVNYANIDDLEAVLEDVGIPYHVEHEAGCDYPAGCWSWLPVAGKIEAMCAHDTGPVVTVEDLRTAILSDDPTAAISEMIADADAANGKGLPPFAISDAVRAHFASQKAA